MLETPKAKFTLMVVKTEKNNLDSIWSNQPKCDYNGQSAVGGKYGI